jgi:hypothetical protein
MVETTADEASTVDVATGRRRDAGAEVRHRHGDRHAHRPAQGSNIKDSPLVFVGYGVDAPEQHWNDYAGIDVKGKTVVMLVNDPGFHAGKDEAVRRQAHDLLRALDLQVRGSRAQGRRRALIIHDTAGASYGWDVVKNSWSGPQYDLPAKDDPGTARAAQGWITGEAALPCSPTPGRTWPSCARPPTSAASSRCRWTPRCR